MRTLFKDLQSLRQELPGPSEMIEWENSIQYPHAKFIVAGLMNVAEEQDLVAFFDVGTKDMVLWIWVAGDLNDPVANSGSYIDEYYEIPIEEAKGFYGEVFNLRNQ